MRAPLTTRSRYPRIVVVVLAAGLGITGLVNRVVDPYRIFSADPDAVHDGYPALHANLRLHKARQVSLQKPNALVLGTSKAIQGFPLDHPRFANRRVYNLAMPLATMRENAYLLRHAIANAPLEDVVLSLDFLSFNVRARTDGPAAGFVPGRLEGSPDAPADTVPDLLAALLSLDALRASAAVLRGAEGGPHRVVTGRGGREDAEIRSRLDDGGHRSNTRRIEAFFIDSVYLPAPHREFAFDADGRNSFDAFETFLDSVHEHDVPTTLVIGPSHARLWELIRVAGLWPRYEAWKRRLVETNERVAREHGRTPLPLWDFTAPGPITTEPFPAAGDVETRMSGYYESIHFNQATGARVLDRITGPDAGDDGDGARNESAANRDADTSAEANAAIEPGRFGVRLTGDNVEHVLVAIREAQDVFGANDRSRSLELERIVRETIGE